MRQKHPKLLRVRKALKMPKPALRAIDLELSLPPGAAVGVADDHRPQRRQPLQLTRWKIRLNPPSSRKPKRPQRLRLRLLLVLSQQRRNRLRVNAARADARNVVVV